MKHLNLLFLFLCTSTISFAQIRVGVLAGGNLMTQKRSADDDQRRAINSPIPAYHAGILFSIPISKQLSFQPGLNYQLKGYKASSTTSLLCGSTVSTQENTKYNYLELPLTLSYTLDAESSFKVTPFVGVYVAYAMSGKYTVAKTVGDDTTTTTESLNFKEGDKRWDYGTRLGVDFEFKKIFLRLHYASGFADITRGASQTSKNRGFGLSVGYWIK